MIFIVSRFDVVGTANVYLMFYKYLLFIQNILILCDLKEIYPAAILFNHIYYKNYHSTAVAGLAFSR